MHLVLLTRFHSRHVDSAFVRRLMEEADRLGHTLLVINPQDVTLEFSNNNGLLPIKWRGSPFPPADIILPVARWDDSATWQIAEALKAWHQPILMDGLRVPMGDHVTVARMMARYAIPAPRSWVLNHPKQLEMVMADITFPCLLRSRFGGSGRRLLVIQHSGEAMAAAREISKEFESFVVQELPPPQGVDVRVLVAGNKVLAAVERIAPPGFVRPRETGNTIVTATALSPREEEIALKTAEMYGVSFCAINLLRTAEGPLMLEVSTAPTLSEMEQATRQNLAAQIVHFLLERVQKNAAKVVPFKKA